MYFSLRIIRRTVNVSVVEKILYFVNIWFMKEAVCVLSDWNVSMYFTLRMRKMYNQNHMNNACIYISILLLKFDKSPIFYFIYALPRV